MAPLFSVLPEPVIVQEYPESPPNAPFRKKTAHPSDTLWYQNGCAALVEAAGIEPASENLSTQLSPGADGLLKFPRRPANRQADRQGIP